MPAVYSRLSALHTGIGRKDFLPNVSVVLNQKMSYKLVILLPNSYFVTRFVASLCIFCLLIVKNSKVCLNKQITMLSIQQFSHTLSVVQIYQYGYISLRYGESSVFCYSTCDNLNCPMWSVQNVIDLHWC